MKRTALGRGLLALALLTAGCSGSGDDTATADADGPAGSTTTAGDGTGTTSAPERPDGPAATFGPELTGGNGISLLSAAEVPDAVESGYSEAEYPAAGTAIGYTGELPTDGRFELTEEGSGDFNTRVLVRRPVDAGDFNGTVVVEWLNVSSGSDFSPDYTYLAEEILRQGYAWVGVSAQHIGIEGGPVAVPTPAGELTGAGEGIVNFDPERYGDLSHPGDAFSYDIFTQIGRALRTDDEANPLGDLAVERLLAVGESQSAFALTTYVNGVQPLTGAFDGFLIHSRGGAAAPLGEPGEGIDITATFVGEPTTIRTDLDVPVITVQTETDVLGILNSFPSRQEDNDRFRLWEIAGTAHADAFQLGAAEAVLECPQPINRGQQNFVLRAALRHLDSWAQGGEAPPTADRLGVDESGDPPVYETDEVGNVTGGVRTPAVDAPVDVLTGLAAPDSTIICLLMGSTAPIPDDRLSGLYASPDAYRSAYEDSADAAIGSGFVLADDRDALIADADPERIPG
ncbi:MAG: hypothetical protein KDB24_08675 [Microthrixaceae bacterium]|nr:hypothetical protein [Microthrixaceae bacterium]